MSATRATLSRWNADPWPVLREWVAWSLATAVALLIAVYVVARLSTPDVTRLALPGVNASVDLGDYGLILFRNGLVLVDKRGFERIGYPSSQVTPERLAHDLRLLERE